MLVFSLESKLDDVMLIIFYEGRGWIEDKIYKLEP